MAIEEVSDMFSDLIILVFESTSLVGTRPIRNEYFGLLEFVWQHGFTLSFMAANKLQLEGQPSKEFERTWAIGEPTLVVAAGEALAEQHKSF